ncbi:MAG: TetR/AcrR family transcriptional regulator [Acidimicrobiales bacterium]
MDVEPNGTANRILEAALRTLARQGADNFSMASIGREAHVSRRTLYRYFHNRDEVLEAVAVHIGNSYARAIDEAIAANPDIDRRIEVILSATVNYGDFHPAALAVMQMEPGFTFQFLQSTLPDYIEVARKGIEPVAQQVPALRSGSVTVEQVAEVVIRLGISGFSFPSKGAEDLGEVLTRLIRG